jgi:hypothetical protein
MDMVFKNLDHHLINFFNGGPRHITDGAIRLFCLSFLLS